MQYSAANFQVLGHDWAVEQLALAFNSGRMRHAYLISGPPSIGKTAMARSIAMALNCTAESGRPCGECRACKLIAQDKHPDINVVQSEHVGATLKIEQIREMQRIVSLRPYEARYRVAILHRFHEASNTAPDALLKTLEEPPSNVVLIVTTEDAGRLLATIRSRCQPYYLQPLRIQEVEHLLQKHWQAAPEQAKLLAHLSGGRIGWAIDALQDQTVLAQRDDEIALLERLLLENRKERFDVAGKLAKEKSAMLGTLQLWQAYWRDALLLSNNVPRWITNIDRVEFLEALVRQQPPAAFQKALDSTRTAYQYLTRNVNTRLALEAMLLDYPFVKSRKI